MRTTYWNPSLLIVATLLTGNFSASAFEMRMIADTLTLDARDTPLRDILARFQEAGVRVAIDERINPLITAHFENREIGEGIKRMLADCDYALTWQTIEGPAGKLRRISEILVYKPGSRRPLPPLPTPPSATLSSQTGQTNTVFCLKNQILLRLRPGTTKEQLLALLRETGTTVMDSIPALSLYRLYFPPGTDMATLLNELSRNPVVARAEPNQIYRSLTPEQSPGTPSGGSLRTLPNGDGPAVAVLDSGFTPSPALEKAVVATLDATAPGTPISDPVGHGTQMALIAAGAINPQGGYPALDSEAGSIIPIRTMTENGLTSSFTLMQSMVFALEQGARVINMSWGSETDSGFFNQAIAYARQRGAVPVAAAGNEPTNRPLYPAASPDVLAVGALGADGALWDHSNFGSFISLAAPGLADFPVGYKGPPGAYAGTSIAAAYTARVLARYFALHPAATANEAVSALKQALSPPASGAAHADIPRLDAAAVSRYLK